MSNSQSLSLRLASESDADVIKALMDRAIHELQIGYLTPDQIVASSAAMGLDRQLIADQSYFTVWAGQQLVGCGGWSYRSTLYGGDHSAGRDIRMLDPATERARIRAMYTHPEFVNRGIGRMILSASEAAAKDAGFRALEMAATMAGKPFYAKCGYHVESEWFDENGAVPVPLATMVKSIAD
jgi:GNAT superfamily N-acetyltransferase